MSFKNIVFDFGGVLIDWNPRHLFRKIFSGKSEMEDFLSEVCTDEWNVQQDAGRTLKEGTERLIDQYPEKADLICLYYDRWPEMLNGPIDESVALLSSMRNRYCLYGLTNWSAETYPIALERFEFLKWFDGIIVSGYEKMVKPSPQIFSLLLSRYHIKAEESLFIDDNRKNVDAAAKAGFTSIHFISPGQLKQSLTELGVKL